MPQIPLVLANAMTQQQGTDLIALETSVQAAIGILTSPDSASINAKLSTVVNKIGEKSETQWLCVCIISFV